MERYYVFANYWHTLKNLILKSIPYFLHYLWINIMAGVITAVVFSIIFYEKRNESLNKFLKFIIISMLLLFEIFVIFYFYKLFGIYSLLLSLMAVLFIVIDNI